MRRDMELIAKVLAQVEGFPANGGHVEVEGYPDDVVDYHVGLLGASGYLRHGSKRHVEGLTWRGHDLCDELSRVPLAETITAHAAAR
jgi:hypothetical protein